MKTRSVLIISVICIAVLLFAAFILYWRSFGFPLFGNNPFVEVGLVPESGVLVTGRYYSSPGKVENRGVILLHMLGGSQDDWNKFASTLQDQNFEVMTLDFRGHGESSGAWKKMENEDFAHLVDDAGEAIEYLQDINSDMRIAVVGASIGANVAVQLAAQNDAVSALVLLSPSANYRGIDITTINGALTLPIFYIASRDDEQAVGPTQELYDASPSSTKEINIYDKGGHGTTLLRKKKGLQTTIVNWLEDVM